METKKDLVETSAALANNDLTRVVRLKRSKGKIIQDCDVYIGRACNRGGWNLPTSKWANPFPLWRYDYDRKLVNEMYKNYIKHRLDLLTSLHELKGQR